MKFVTREKPRVGRVACPWLIKKFIDTNAELLFVPADQVMAVAERENALPYDVPIEGEDTLIVAWVALIRRMPSDLGAVSKTPIRATSR